MATPLKVGLVGTGGISNRHITAYLEHPDRVKLTAVCDLDETRAQEFARKAGVEAVYTDFDKMLREADIDAVDNCTFHPQHAPLSIASAEAGKHVIVEKPLEVTLKRCDRIIRACEHAGVTLSTIFPSRFHESSQLIKRAIDRGRFGRLTMGDAYVKWFRTQEYYDSGAWRGTWKLDGGGALMNQAIHSVDLLTWLMGPVAQVSAYTSTLTHQRIEVEDVATATLRFSNGALGVIEATTAAYPGTLKRIEIHGSEGSAVLEEEDIKNWEFARAARGDAALRRRMTGKTESGGGATDPAAIGHHGHGVAPVGEGIGFRFIGVNRHADRGNAWGVGYG